MYLFAVYTIDRVEHTMVCVGDMLTRSEAGEIKRCLEKFNACDVQIVTSAFVRRKEDFNHEHEVFL